MGFLKLVQGVSICLSLFLAVSTSLANEEFDLVSEGDNLLCKVSYENGSKKQEPTSCFPRLEVVPQKIDILAQSKNILEILASGNKLSTPEELASLGGAMMLEEVALEYVVDNYTALEIVNLSLKSGAPIKTSDGYKKQLFYADLRWASNLGFSGTIHLEGEIIAHENFLEAIQKDTPDLRPKIINFSDKLASTIFGQSRVPNSFSRNVHFVSISGSGAEDIAGLEGLFENVVTPVIFGEVFYVNYFKALAKLPAALEDAIKEFFNSFRKPSTRTP